MLELRRVSKHFSGIAAVDDVSFSARPGEVTGYLGPNGSGKSTTMKMITGLIEMTFGHIYFQGKPIQDDLIAYKRRMGYVPEEPYLYNHLSGTEYLTMVAQLRNLPARESSERIDGLLRLLSLHDDRHASISGYSKVKSPNVGYAPSLPPAKEYNTVSLHGQSAVLQAVAGGCSRKTTPLPAEPPYVGCGRDCRRGR